MEKENYKPWDIDFAKYEECRTWKEKLHFLINFAVLAPSSHNSQPWIFEIRDQSIFIYQNSLRKLKVGDPDNRLLLMNLGCAIENIRVAADYYGLSYDVSYLPDAIHENLVAIIRFDETAIRKNSSHLIFSIVKRSVNRSNYHREPLSIEFREALSQLDNPKMNINVVDGHTDKEGIADIIVSSNIELMDNSKFRRELSPYVKNNITKSKIGIPAFGMGIPLLPSFIVPNLVKFFNMDRLNKSSTLKILTDGTPAYILLSSMTDTKVDWIKVGECYERIALIAEQFNLKTAVWAAPILSPNYREKLNFFIKPGFHSQFIFRVGRAITSQPHSPRLSVSDVLKN